MDTVSAKKPLHRWTLKLCVATALSVASIRLFTGSRKVRGVGKFVKHLARFLVI